MADAAAAIEQELEALAALYPDDGLVVRRASDGGRDEPLSESSSRIWKHTTVSLDVAPRTLDDETTRFVRATLTLTLDNDYPRNPPSVTLTNARGLDDVRQAFVFRGLEDACRGLTNQPILALLCECAFDCLSEMNFPDGDCAFCLTPVDAGRGGDREQRTTRRPFMKLMTCYHCFHENCFVKWWRWKARAAVAAAAERGAHAAAACRLPPPPTHMCPVCRVPIEDDDVRHVNLDGDEKDEKDDEKDDDDENAAGTSERVSSSAERARRERFAAAMKRQQHRNGLIDVGACEIVLTSARPRASDLVTLNAHTTEPRANTSSGGHVPKPKQNADTTEPRASTSSGGHVPFPKLKPNPGGGRGGGFGWLKKAAGAHADMLNESVGKIDIQRDGTGGRSGGRGRGRGGRETRCPS
jgi:E3 ubiquitin-protein ligase RNF25